MSTCPPSTTKVLKDKGSAEWYYLIPIFELVQLLTTSALLSDMNAPRPQLKVVPAAMKRSAYPNSVSATETKETKELYNIVFLASTFNKVTVQNTEIVRANP